MSPSTSKPQDAFKMARSTSLAKVVNVVKRELENVPLFDIAETPPPVTAKPFQGPRTVRLVRCACGHHRAGLIAGAGDHLVWRKHLVHTAAGGSYPCPSSGRCLCQVPAPDTAGIHTPTCDDHGPWTA